MALPRCYHAQGNRDRGQPSDTIPQSGRDVCHGRSWVWTVHGVTTVHEVSIGPGALERAQEPPERSWVPSSTSRVLSGEPAQCGSAFCLGGRRQGTRRSSFVTRLPRVPAVNPSGAPASLNAFGRPGPC